MARARSPNRDKAFEIYKDHNGNIDLVKISEILNISPGTVRGWKNKDKWEENLNGTLRKEKLKNTERSKRNNKVIKEPTTEEVEEVLNNSSLTDKQRLFCVYYIKYFNATKSYQKAYGCDYITANTNGPRLLVNARIKKEIQILKEGKLNRIMLSEEDIFQKYIDIAFADITDYVEFGQEEVPVMGAFGPVVDKETEEVITKIVNVVKFKESAEIDGTIISEVKQGKDGASIKLQDKMKALQWLSDRMDLLPTETKTKIENEKIKVQMAQEKLALEKSKVTGDDGNEEDDGFLEALKGTVSEVWSDE